MKHVRFFAAILVGVFSTAVTMAADIRLYKWIPPSRAIAPLILPVRVGEKPEAAAERYLKGLEHSPDMMELFQGQRPTTATGEFIPLDGAPEKQALLVANLPKDYGPDSERITNFTKMFKKRGQTSYILPVKADLGLSLNESRKFLDLISDSFRWMIPLGGEDVDPVLYKKGNFHSHNTNRTRDEFEISLIRHYVSKEKGFLLAVCRGSQITSVALGYKLIQDVPIQVGTNVAHGEDWHDIEVKKTTHGILASLLPADSNKLFVNSFHHQAVQFRTGGLLELAASTPDGVTEATEFKNGRGLLLQFHPEFMENILAERIMDRVVEQQLRLMAPSCSKVFQH